MLRLNPIHAKNKTTAPELPIFILGGVLLALFVYAFYATPIKSSIEKILLDFKTQLRINYSQGYQQNKNEVVIIPIDQNESKLVDPKKLTLNVEKSVSLIEQVLKRGPSQVVFFMYPGILEPMNKKVSPILDLSQKYPNLYFGTLDIIKETPRNLNMKTILPLKGRFLGLDTHREREQSIRKMPLHSYFGLERTLLMPAYISLKHNKIEPTIDNLTRLGFTNEEILGKKFLLNYGNFKNLTTLSPEKITHSSTAKSLKDKIVLISPVYFKKRVTDEHLFVKTPFDKRDMLAEKGEGVPLVYLESLAIQNLLNKNYLRKLDWEFPVTFVQVGFFLILAFITLRYSLTIAILSTLVSWSLLFVIHIYLINSKNLILPMANAAFFSFISTFIGGIWRMIFDSKIKISKEIKTSSSAKISSARSLFLRKFSQTLSFYNKNVIDTLSDIKIENEKFANIQKKLFESSKEFEVYLDTIEQFASLTENDTRLLNRTEFNVIQFLEKIISKFSISLKRNDISINIDCSSTLSLYTDKTFLEPILFNLISNAIKYSPSSSKITIKVRKNLFNKTSFYVIDEGFGIPAKYHDKIFEKFYRITGESSINVKGTGLGLFLCRFFTLRLKGSLKVESEVDKGSTFILTV